MDAVSHFFKGIATEINGLGTNLSGNVSINIALDATPHERTLTTTKNHNEQVLPVYLDNDDISGRIGLELSQTYRYDHLGLKCFLIGFIEIYNEPHLSSEFTLLSKELEPAGYLTANKQYKFKFSHFDKDYETFKGSAGRVRYFIRVALNRNVIGPLTEEEEFAVLVNQDLSKLEMKPTLLSVGVDDRLHIEFLLFKNYYHIKEWVEGTVTFLNTKMQVARMEISLVRKESLGTPESTTSSSKVLETFEVMDGCPGEGDSIPFRMCMKGVKNLTPSYKSIHNRLFVRHWFMVIIYDDSGRRYFKQAEIAFYRK